MWNQVLLVSNAFLWGGITKEHKSSFYHYISRKQVYYKRLNFCYCTISINSAHHTSQAPVLCWKLAQVTGHKGQCRRGQTWDSAEKSKIGSKTGHFTVFTAYFVYFGLRGLQPPLTGHKTLETANFGIVRCRNFRSVTVTGHLCRSVELVQRVTVTGVCRIERNGTVPQSRS